MYISLQKKKWMYMSEMLEIQSTNKFDLIWFDLIFGA